MAVTWPIRFINDAKPGNALKRKESVVKDYVQKNDCLYSLGKLGDCGFSLIRIKV
jgi:hypothetical protein